MALSTDEYSTMIKQEVQATPELEPLANNTKKRAKWKLFADVIAFIGSFIDSRFDAHEAKIEAKLATMRPHKPSWLEAKIRNFQYGGTLLPESDIYDNTGLTEEQVEGMKICKYVAAEELTRVTRVKVATEVDGVLTKLNTAQMNALIAYVKVFKDIGVRMSIESNDPDALKLSVDIYYNPLILNAQGERIDSTNRKPVKDAINKYLANMGFNGLFIPTKLVDVLQEVEGVEIPDIIIAQAKYGNFPFSDVGAKYRADAGYMRIYDDRDLTINYIPYDV